MEMSEKSAIFFKWHTFCLAKAKVLQKLTFFYKK